MAFRTAGSPTTRPPLASYKRQRSVITKLANAYKRLRAIVAPPCAPTLPSPVGIAFERATSSDDDESRDDIIAGSLHKRHGTLARAKSMRSRSMPMLNLSSCQRHDERTPAQRIQDEWRARNWFPSSPEPWLISPNVDHGFPFPPPHDMPPNHVSSRIDRPDGLIWPRPNFAQHTCPAHARSGSSASAPTLLSAGRSSTDTQRIPTTPPRLTLMLPDTTMRSPVRSTSADSTDSGNELELCDQRLSARFAAACLGDPRHSPPLPLLHTPREEVTIVMSPPAVREDLKLEGPAPARPPRSHRRRPSLSASIVL